jgi:hypothetical protein
LAPVRVVEFANRYRLPLTEPDSAASTPVLLNIHTLSRALSDTAQGPIEPPNNVIDPQLPGEQGKPILWKEVVGSAPFFLRFDEWLARQQPFFAENLFALRTQVDNNVRGFWLTDDRKNFLTYHKGIASGQSMTPYSGYFATIDEVHRSATFLLAYGAADAKLAADPEGVKKFFTQEKTGFAAKLNKMLEQLAGPKNSLLVNRNDALARQRRVFVAQQRQLIATVHGDAVKQLQFVGRPKPTQARGLRCVRVLGVQRTGHRLRDGHLLQ